MSQPLLQGDIPAREQDSLAQTGTGDGGWLLWGFGGLDPPALLSSLLLPPTVTSHLTALAKKGIPPPSPTCPCR